MASHPVGHSADAAKNRSGTVLLQSVTLAFRTGADVGSGAQRTCRLERSESLRAGVRSSEIIAALRFRYRSLGIGRDPAEPELLGELFLLAGE